MKKLLVIITMLVSGLAVSQNKFPEVGEQAIDFTLKTVSEEAINLYKLLENKSVVLVVLRGWPGYQCPICSRQVGSLVANSEEFTKRNVSVLMVYPGSSKELVDHANEFKEDFEFPKGYYFVIDPDYKMINLYGLRWDANRETAYPSTFVVDTSGKILFAKISQTHGGRSDVDEIFKVLDKK